MYQPLGSNTYQSSQSSWNRIQIIHSDVQGHIEKVEKLFFETEVVVRIILSQIEIEKYKFIIIYLNLWRRTRSCTDGLEGPARRAAEGWSSASSANSDMEEGWICGFATTLGTAAVLVAGSVPSTNSDMEEG
jgi:hypothetical protein